VEFLKKLLSFALHLDSHLHQVFVDYGAWTYGILFVIIFCETGLVVTPFLPGDSLLFAVGALAAAGGLHVGLLFVLLAAAAIMGNTLNYSIGRFIGPKAFTDRHRFFRTEYLYRAHAFYERHGGKAIALSRFLPIFRTFAPFVAGIGAMSYPRFLLFNAFGGMAWVATFLLAGYFFGNIPFVKNNFSLVIMGIIVVTVIPPVVGYFRHRRQASPGA
jgi:membrane-associated protein